MQTAYANGSATAYLQDTLVSQFSLFEWMQIIDSWKKTQISTGNSNNDVTGLLYRYAGILFFERVRTVIEYLPPKI